MNHKKINLYIELALFLILGFLVGAILKAESAKKLTMGFNDYQAPTLKQNYDFIQIQKNLEEASQNPESNTSADDTGQSGRSCSNQ
jgi:hypothetical protein